MQQTSIATFFKVRKRAAEADIYHTKSKKACIDNTIGVTSTPSKAPAIDVNTEKVVEISSKQNVEETQTSKHVLKNGPVQPSCTDASIEKTGQALSKKANSINKKKGTIAEDLSSAHNTLSLGDIRKKLSRSSKLLELRAQAERISSGINQLKAASESKNLQQFKSIDVEVPTSPSKRPQIQNEFSSPKKEQKQGTSQSKLLMSPRKVVVSPIKSPSKIPAYLRTASSSLPLPHHYRFLAELFRAMETVVSLLHNRKEKITFNKLKPSVQEMLKRNFNEKHLAQIKHLVPDFYNFEVKKIKQFSATSHKESHELVVTPNFPNDIKVMNPTVLIERRRYFYDTLLKLVKKHHSQFLKNLEVPMDIPDDKITRWHPEFEIEKLPEIECAKLPEMPNADNYNTAQDVLSHARELFNCNTKMERALERLAQAKARGLTNEEKAVTGIKDEGNKPKSSTGTQTNQPSTSGITLLNPALRNLPAALLEKVKAKQAAKALEAMTRSTETEQKYMMYSRLADLARTLRNIYVTERKNVLALNVVLSKLDSSFKANVTAGELEKDIKLLCEEAPEWLKMHDIRNASYLKLDRNMDLQSIIAKLDNLAQKYKA